MNENANPAKGERTLHKEIASIVWVCGGHDKTSAEVVADLIMEAVVRAFDAGEVPTLPKQGGRGGV